MLFVIGFENPDYLYYHQTNNKILKRLLKNLF